MDTKGYHGIPWDTMVSQGLCRRYRRKLIKNMVYHCLSVGYHEESMGYHAISRDTWSPAVCRWDTRDYHGDTAEYHGIPQLVLRIPWNFRGIPMQTDGIPEFATGIPCLFEDTVRYHGIPWDTLDKYLLLMFEKFENVNLLAEKTFAEFSMVICWGSR